MRMLPVLCVVVACSGPPEGPTRSPQQRIDDSATAVTALQTSRFEDALNAASAALVRDPANSRAAAIRALARYQGAGHQFFTDIEQILEQSDVTKLLDHEAGRATWATFLDELEKVHADLIVASKDPGFSLELCLACWEHDWNRSGEIDDRDRLLFQLEVDANGNEIAETDPRRKPTYRFDVGDVEWALAMVSFQRAAVEIVLAYKWTELDLLLGSLFGSNAPKITITLDDGRRVKRARELILNGLDHAERCRAAYLAETDDDREWVPSPRQRSYAMPLPVDDKLYANWLAIVGDVRRMLKSEDGISFRELEQLAEGQSRVMPDAFLDLGAMLREPRDIVIDLADFRGDPTPATVEKVLRGVLGRGYVVRMKPSPIVGRFRQMRDELSRGEDTFDRKLRYLLWLN